MLRSITIGLAVLILAASLARMYALQNKEAPRQAVEEPVPVLAGQDHSVDGISDHKDESSQTIRNLTQRDSEIRYGLSVEPKSSDLMMSKQNATLGVNAGAPATTSSNVSAARKLSDQPSVANPVTGDGPLGSGPQLADSGLPGPGEILKNTGISSGPGPSQFDQSLPGPVASIAAGSDPSQLSQDLAIQGQTHSNDETVMMFHIDLTLPGPGEGQLNPGGLDWPADGPGGNDEGSLPQ